MKTRILTGVLALAGLLAAPSMARADGFFRPFSGPFDCGTFCVCHFNKMHFHGPLYSYGPYNYGYGGGNCGHGGCGWNFNLFNRGCNTGCGNWRGYALSTWKNIFHRTHPCGNKAGCLGSCGCK